MKIVFVFLLLLNCSVSKVFAGKENKHIIVEEETSKRGLKQRRPAFSYHKLIEESNSSETLLKSTKVEDINSFEEENHIEKKNLNYLESMNDEYNYDEEFAKFVAWLVKEYKQPFDINLMVDYLKSSVKDYTAFKISAKASFGIEKEDHLFLLRQLCLLPKGKEKEISGLKF